MKKLVFVVIAVLLIGGVWYMDKSINKTSPKGSNFEKALKIMKNLQSSAIPVILTESDLSSLETGYAEAIERKPQITSFRDTDLGRLTQKLIAAGLTGTGENDPQTRIIDLATGLVDNYNLKNSAGALVVPNPITNLINNSLANSTQAVKDDIRKTADSVNRLTNDVLITNLFINQYRNLRPNICQKPLDQWNHHYIAGTVNMKYSTYRATITSGGSGYTTAPTYTISFDPVVAHLGGNNCFMDSGTITVSGGAITSIPSITCTKDAPVPRITFSAPTATDGSIATATYEKVIIPPIVDTCTGNALTEHICSNLSYTVDAEHVVTKDCEFGCNAGACKKGSVGTVDIVDAGTASGMPITDVKANQTFFLKVTPRRAHTATATSNPSGTVATMVSVGLGYTTAPVVTVVANTGTCTSRPTARATINYFIQEVVSVKLIGGNCTVAPLLSITPPTVTEANSNLSIDVDPSSNCTLAGRTQRVVTSNTPLYFGPMVCSTVTTATLGIVLKDTATSTSQTIETVTKPLSIGGVTMSRFDIDLISNSGLATAPVADSLYSFKVKTVGTNNIPYTNYTDNFFIVVEGDDGAVFPKGPQRMAGFAEKDFTIKFSKEGVLKSGGNVKITVRGVGVDDTAERSLLVTSADLSVKNGIASSTNEYKKVITVNAGDPVTFKWASVNGGTPAPTAAQFSCNNANGTACASSTWAGLGNSLNGTLSFTPTAAHKGKSYFITYKVNKNATTFVTDIVTLNINE